MLVSQRVFIFGSIFFRSKETIESPLVFSEGQMPPKWHGYRARHIERGHHQLLVILYRRSWKWKKMEEKNTEVLSAQKLCFKHIFWKVSKSEWIECCQFFKSIICILWIMCLKGFPVVVFPNPWFFIARFDQYMQRPDWLDTKRKNLGVSAGARM